MNTDAFSPEETRFTMEELTEGFFRTDRERFILNDSDSDGITVSVPLCSISTCKAAMKVWKALGVSEEEVLHGDYCDAWLDIDAAVNPNEKTVVNLYFEVCGVQDASCLYLDILPEHQKVLYSEIEKSCPDLNKLCQAAIEYVNDEYAPEL